MWDKITQVCIGMMVLHNQHHKTRRPLSLSLYTPSQASEPFSVPAITHFVPTPQPDGAAERAVRYDATSDIIDHYSRRLGFLRR